MVFLNFLTTNADTLSVETEESVNGFVAEVSWCLLYIDPGVLINNLLQFQILFKVPIFFIRIQIFGDVMPCQPINIDVLENR